MDLGEAGLVLLATILMIVGLVLAFVPIMPGPVLLWAVSTIYAVLSNFERMTPIAVMISTVVMIAGTTSDFWLPLFGIRTGGLSCLSAVGAFVGGFLGTFIVPIPVISTLVGAVVGAALVELTRMGELRKALRAGRTAAKMYLVSYIVQLVASIAIFVIYIVTVQSTAP